MHTDTALQDAFLQMLQQHQRLVHKISALYAGSREDQEDLGSEIVLQLWRAFPGYRGDAAITTWLYRIALNTAITQQRNSGRMPVTKSDDGWLSQIPDTRSEEDENLLRLRRVIHQLPEIDRALVLLFFEERSHAEIAEILGISVSNVGTRLSRIKMRLKKIMTGSQQ